MNKIISIDEKTSIDNVLKRDILIPVKVYKVPIIIKKDYELNFLEKTILDLKNVDNSLEQKDIVNLLGLNSKEDLVKFVLNKIEEENLIQNNQKEDKEDEVKIYWFYQELITGKLLPIISQEITDFCHTKEEKWSNIEDVKNIKFEKNSKNISAKSFRYENYPNPTKDEFIKTIIINNQYIANSKYLTKIRYKQLSNFNTFDSETMYLHTRLFIPQDNRNIILITDGLDGDFSNYLIKIIEDNFSDFMSNLKSRSKIDIDHKSKQNIQIPFDGKIENFREIKHLIVKIETDLQKYEVSISADEKIRYKKEILKNLFDAIEKSFEKLSKNLQCSTLINRERIINLAKEKSFKVKGKMNIFGVSNKNNIQKFIALAIFHNCEEIQRLDKNSFIFLDNLLKIRNDLKHSTPIDVNSININDFIHKSYGIISLILRIRQKAIKKDDIKDEDIVDNEKELYFNAANDIDEYFLTIKNKIDNHLKEQIAQIKFIVDELPFSQDSIKQAINEIYSTFEYIFKDIEKIDKKKVFEKYSNLPIELQTVKINKSLGTYYLNYIFHFGNRQDLTNFIVKIIKLRGHGNQNITHFSVSKEELKDIKSKTFEYIKHIMEGK